MTKKTQQLKLNGGTMLALLNYNSPVMFDQLQDKTKNRTDA